MESQHEISFVELEDLSSHLNANPKNFESDSLVRLADIKLKVSAHYGHRKATLGEVSEYKVGDFIEVERLAGHAVDVYVGQEKIAVGEILEMDNNNFGLKILEVLTKNGDFLKHVKKNGDVE